MTTGDVALIITIGFWIAVFIGRHWLTTRISKSVQHGFDLKIEEMRAEFRRVEEQFKSDLRDKEAEISTLRTNLLAGSAARQSLLDKRRFEAVEKVWTTVNEFAQLKNLSAMIAVLNVEAVAKKLDDPRMKQFLAIIGTVAPDLQKLRNVARDERPFIPELAWAYFNAYTTILYGNHLRFVTLKAGLSDPEKLMSTHVQKVLKAALPHQGKFIDDNPPSTYHYLLEEIETCLLLELRKILEGEEADQASAAKAKAIMDAVKEAKDEQTVAAGELTKLRGD